METIQLVRLAALLAGDGAADARRPVGGGRVRAESGVGGGGHPADVPVRRIPARAQRGARVAARLGAAGAGVRRRTELRCVRRVTARGEATCAAVYGPFYERLRLNIRALHPALDAWMIVEGYGKVLGRPGLDLARRELACRGGLRGRAAGPAAALAPHGAFTRARRRRQVDAAAARDRRHLLGSLDDRVPDDLRRVLLGAACKGTSTMFIDRVVVRVEAGTGGSGASLVPPREVRIPWAVPTAATAAAAAT